MNLPPRFWPEINLQNIIKIEGKKLIAAFNHARKIRFGQAA